MSVSSARLLCNTRSACPALLFLPVFIAGQVAALLLALRFGTRLETAWYLAGCYSIAAGAAVLAARLRRGTLRLAFLQLLAGAAGIASGLVTFVPAAAPHGMRPYAAVVDAEPRRRAPGGIELSLRLREIGVRHTARDAATRPARVICKGADLPWRNAGAAVEGSAIIVRARFRSVQKGVRASINPFSFDAALFRRGYAATCRMVQVSRPHAAAGARFSRLKEMLINRVHEAVSDDEQAGLLLSMSIGVRDVLSDLTEQGFRNAGLAHLLVVSGYQVSLVYYSARFLLRRLIFGIPFLRRGARGYYLAALLPVVPALLFVAMVGVEGSSLRAALAAILFAVSLSFERHGGLLNAIGASLLMLSVLWPACALDPGVELTYAALTGIWLGTLGGRKGLAAFVSVSFWGTLLPSLVGLAWFGNISPIGFVLNPLLGFLASAVSCNGGLAALALLYLQLPGGETITRRLAALLGYFRDFVVYAGGLPGAALHPQGAARWTAFGVAAAFTALAALRRIQRALPPRVLR